MFRIITFIIFFLITPLIWSQNTKVISDFRIKTRIEFDYKTSKPIKLSAGFQGYFEKDASELDEYFAEFEISYTPYKFIVFGTGYRHTWNYSIKQKQWNGSNRLHLNTTLKYKFRKFRFRYRLMYQNIDDDLFLYANDDNIAKNILRNKIRVKYKRKKRRISPFVSFEYYSNFGSVQASNKMKFDVGLDYSLKKYGELRTYYQIMKEHSTNYPYTFYILYVGYSYSF